MYSSYICNLAWFGAQRYDQDKVADIIVDYNEKSICDENYMSKNFANTYFSTEDCKKIGFIREDIEDKFRSGEINDRERAILITALLYACDKIALTCGHYDAYRKGAEFTNSLELYVPQAEVDNNLANRCFHEDAGELVKHITADVVYMDPPYNSRQYCDTYHLLENVARWEKPEVSGIAKKMNREGMKSKYCTSQATEAFETLVKNVQAKVFTLSYNNMGEKGNNRSNAKISDDDIIRILRKKGKVKIFEEPYKSFSTGKSAIEGNTERLFFCRCY